MQAAQSPASILHWKLEPVSLELKVKAAEVGCRFRARLAFDRGLGRLGVGGRRGIGRLRRGGIGRHRRSRRRRSGGRVVMAMTSEIDPSRDVDRGSGAPASGSAGGEAGGGAGLGRVGQLFDGAGEKAAVRLRIEAPLATAAASPTVSATTNTIASALGNRILLPLFQLVLGIWRLPLWIRQMFDTR